MPQVRFTPDPPQSTVRFTPAASEQPQAAPSLVDKLQAIRDAQKAKYPTNEERAQGWGSPSRAPDNRDARELALGNIWDTPGDIWNVVKQIPGMVKPIGETLNEWMNPAARMQNGLPKSREMGDMLVKGSVQPATDLIEATASGDPNDPRFASARGGAGAFLLGEGIAHAPKIGKAGLRAVTTPEALQTRAANNRSPVQSTWPDAVVRKTVAGGVGGALGGPAGAATAVAADLAWQSQPVRNVRAGLQERLANFMAEGDVANVTASPTPEAFDVPIPQEPVLPGSRPRQMPENRPPIGAPEEAAIPEWQRAQSSNMWAQDPAPMPETVAAQDNAAWLAEQRRLNTPDWTGETVPDRTNMRERLVDPQIPPMREWSLSNETVPSRENVRPRVVDPQFGPEREWSFADEMAPESTPRPPLEADIAFDPRMQMAPDLRKLEQSLTGSNNPTKSALNKAALVDVNGQPTKFAAELLDAVPDLKPGPQMGKQLVDAKDAAWKGIEAEESLIGGQTPVSLQPAMDTFKKLMAEAAESGERATALRLARIIKDWSKFGTEIPWEQFRDLKRSFMQDAGKAPKGSPLSYTMNEAYKSLMGISNGLSEGLTAANKKWSTIKRALDNSKFSERTGGRLGGKPNDVNKPLGPVGSIQTLGNGRQVQVVFNSDNRPIGLKDVESGTIVRGSQS